MHIQIYIRLRKTSLWGSSEYTKGSMRHWINVGTGCVCWAQPVVFWTEAYHKDMWPGCDQECSIRISEVLRSMSMTSSTCLCGQSRQSCPVDMGKSQRLLYDIVNTVSTRRGTARDATEDNCAVGQNSDASRYKRSRNVYTENSRCCWRGSATLYEGEEINSLILSGGGQNTFETHKKIGRVFRERLQDNEAWNIRVSCWEKYLETMIPCECKLRRYGGTEIVWTNRVMWVDERRLSQNVGVTALPESFCG